MPTWLWKPVNLVQWALVLVWTAALVTLALVSAVFDRRRRVALALARVWARGVLVAVGAKVDRSGELPPSDTGLYVVANHQSYVDIPVLFASLGRPLHFVAKAELGRYPFVGWYIRAMGMVLVDRGRRASGKAGIDQMVELLEDGHAVVSFPEGTRSADGTLQRFRSGGFVAPIVSGVPVLPVAMEGARSIVAARSLAVRPGRVRVRVGEPIATAGRERKARHDLATEARAAIEALLAEPTPDDD